MKFSEKYLSIPPYISTSWSNVKALQMSGNLLVITLADDSRIHIPDLDFEALEQIFEVHASYLESSSRTTESPPKLTEFPPKLQIMKGLSNQLASDIFLEQSVALPFRIGTMSSIEALGAAMQHSLEHANAPDLPREVLKKIASIATIIAPADLNQFPQPEPHCNCLHCQIARAINEGLEGNVNPSCKERCPSQESDEEVCDTDLTFQQWDIHQSGERLFVVSNKLDPKESYRVFLGEPVGCTCGRSGCEHMLAVLHS